MSNFHFGVDDYDLNYYPPEAYDGMCGVDWDKVEYVEIEGDAYVKERTCEMETLERWDGMDPHYRCKACGYENYEFEMPLFCPNCGAKVAKQCTS